VVDVSPLFLIGAQRSGTTLMRLILNAHSQIAIPEEGTFLMPLLKKRLLKREISGPFLKTLLSYFALNPQFKLWGHDFSEYFAQLSKRGRTTVRELMSGIFSVYSGSEGKIIWGDKTPSFFRKIDILFALFPKAKFIHIVRDGRDVFDSWRKMDPSKNNSPLIAIDWSYKLFRIEKSFTKIPPENRITIRYEDLLENPEKAIKSVCSLAGVEYEATMLEFHRTSHKYIGTHHSKLIFKPLSKNNRYKWKNNLTNRETRSFTLLARYFLKKYNYEIEDTGMNIPDMLSILKNIIIGVPMRIMSVWRAKRSLETILKKGQLIDSMKVGELPRGVRKRAGGIKNAPGKEI